MNRSLHKMLGGPSWMARPNKSNALRIEGKRWYSAEDLVAVGWDDYCCAERLESLLLDIESLRPRERGGVVCRVTDDNAFVPEFRFPSKQWAKRVREAVAIIFSQQQLAPPPEDGVAVRDKCECRWKAAGGAELVDWPWA